MSPEHVQLAADHRVDPEQTGSIIQVGFGNDSGFSRNHDTMTLVGSGMIVLDLLPAMDG